MTDSTQQQNHTGLSWYRPAGALAGDQDSILAHLERNTPVRLMATMENLTAAVADEMATDALQRAAAGRFDFLPVRRSRTKPIIGLLDCKSVQLRLDRPVRDVMQPISGANLIGADAPLLDFVYAADQCPCRLVLDAADIRGLVTLSDMQRLPVRTALFSLFIHLELLLTRSLKTLVGGDDTPFRFLSPTRAAAAEAQWKASIEHGMDQDRFNALQFADKRVIAQKVRAFRLSASKIGRELEEIEQRLRNPIAHGTDYALTEEAAKATVRAAQLVREWIIRIRDSGALKPTA
jgi:hypothetical protein